MDLLTFVVKLFDIKRVYGTFVNFYSTQITMLSNLFYFIKKSSKKPYILKPLLAFMARPKKTKIKVVEQKTKIKEISKNVSLEQDIKNEEKEEFQEFMSTRVRVTPVLSNGQQTQDIEETAQQEQVERSRSNNQGDMVKPEFSVYEQARTTIPVNTGVRQRQYVPRNSDEIMDKAIRVERVEKVRPVLGRNPSDVNFVNPELESVRSGNRDYYDEKMKIEKQKNTRRMPWEVE